MIKINKDLVNCIEDITKEEYNKEETDKSHECLMDGIEIERLINDLYDKYAVLDMENEKLKDHLDGLEATLDMYEGKGRIEL